MPIEGGLGDGLPAREEALADDLDAHALVCHLHVLVFHHVGKLVEDGVAR